MKNSSDLSRNTLESKYRLYRRLTIVFAVVAVFLGITLVGQLTMSSPAGSPTADGGSNSGPGTAESGATPVDSPHVRRLADDPMAIGEIDAPVVLIQWTDMRCPFCAAFDRNTLPTIIQEYVDKGLVRVEIHDVAFFGEESEDAAIAARAAGEQGKYFEFLSTVFAAAPESGHADMPREKLISFAKTAGVADIAQFTADLDDPAFRSAVQATTANAQRIGVTAVPFFLANDKVLSGAQPVEVFRNFLDQAVAETR